MKSFFKKLAFVMALAMVVSLAAPAAKSALAANVITYAYQEGGKVESLSMKADETVDLKFIGAPADWKTVGWKWESTNPAVATVDNAGVVTAHADGTAVITCTIGDSTTAGVKVVVGEEMKVVLGTSKTDTFTEKTLKVDEEIDLNFYGVTDWSTSKYTCDWVSTDTSVATVDTKGVVKGVKAGTATVNAVITVKTTGDVVNVAPVIFTVEEEKVVVDYSYKFRQTTHNAFTLTFNNAVDLNKDDVQLFCVFDSSEGPVETAWPVSSATLDDSKTVLTVVPYVEFVDGYNYVVKVKGEETGYAFKASVGQVASIALSYKCWDKAGVAYTNGEDGDIIDVYVSAKLFDKNGVDVTKYSNYSENVTFNLGGEYENVDIDNSTGTMNFYKAGAASVVATYTYVDAEGNEQQIPSAPLPVVCINAPAYEIVKIDKWTIAKNTEEAKKIVWGDHDVAAYDSDYQIIVAITDNYGNTFVNHKGIADLKNDDKIFWTEDEEQAFAKHGYSIQFSSADNDKILIDPTGYLETYTQTTAYTLVSLHNSELDADTDFVKNLTALQVKVTAERALSSVTLDKSSITLVTDANIDELCEGEIRLSVKDQYKDTWYGATAFEITTTDKELKDVHGLTVESDDDGYFIALDGKALKAGNGDKAAIVSFKVTETNSKKSATFSVTLKDPKYVKVGDVITTEISVDGWKLEADASVDQKIESLAKNATATVYAGVTLYETSGSTSVKVDIAKDIEILSKTITDAKLTSSDAVIGNRYMVVTDPDNKVFTDVQLDSKTGEYQIIVAKPVDDVMKYAKEGRYKVTVYEVTGLNTKNEPKFKSTSAYFNVSNSSADLKFVKRTKVATEATDINALVVDAFQFSLGGSEWKNVTSEMVKKVTGINKGSYVIITSVEFLVPLNGKDDSVGYTKTVKGINLSVQIPEGFDASGLKEK